MSTDLDYLYEQQIRLLPRTIRLQLLARIAQELAAEDLPDEQALYDPQQIQTSNEDDDLPVNLLDLEGVGAEIWHGIDAQAYVHALRDEWDKP